MAQGRGLGRWLRDGAFALLGLAALGLAAFLWLRGPVTRATRLRMTAGRFAGERHRLAQLLQSEAARRSIAIDLVETAGSEEALRKVDEGEIDVALAQGGLDLANSPDLQQVAVLHVEPLHLLVKGSIHHEVVAHLPALRGRVVNLGEIGSGTHRLASEVMEFAGLRPGTASSGGDFITSTLGYESLLKESDEAKLPDAVFTVSSLPSPVARHLVRAHGFRLVPLPFFEAFSLQDWNAEDRPAGDGKADSGHGVVRRHLHDAVIPPFTYEVEPGVPPEAVRTLGARLLLVAHKGVPRESIDRLLDVVFESPFARATVPTLDAKLLDLPPELPWHEGTTAYLRRKAPLIAGDVIDLLEKEVSILGVVLGGLFFLGQWVRQRLRRRRDRGFQAYILRVHDIERRALALEEAATLDFVGLIHLRQELARLKGEALQQFAEGTLEGEELMSGFLVHVSDARDYLTRLILHERDHLEERSQAAAHPTAIEPHRAAPLEPSIDRGEGLARDPQLGEQNDTPQPSATSGSAQLGRPIEAAPNAVSVSRVHLPAPRGEGDGPGLIASPELRP